MMRRIVRLRLWAASILRDEAVHQIEDDLLCDQRVSINFCKTIFAKPRALRKTTPVIDVRNGHVINATGDSVRFTDTHHWDVDDLGNVARKDFRKMTDIAGVLNVREHLPCVAEVIQIAPNQLPHKSRGKDCLRVVPVMRYDCLQLVTITAPAITGFLDSTERAVPNNDAVA